MLNFSLLINGTYGILLGLLILSWHLTPVFIKLFVGNKYTLGDYGQMWANWHAIGCFYVGFSNFLAYNWDDSFLVAKQDICLISTFIFGIWGLQNFGLMFQANKMKSLMWLNVIACFASALLALGGYLNI
jgi:hypothetical protein